MPDLVVRKGLAFPIVSLASQSEKGRGFGKSVETFDQNVGLDGAWIGQMRGGRLYSGIAARKDSAIVVVSTESPLR